jgi:hypothetical protein
MSTWKTGAQVVWVAACFFVALAGPAGADDCGSESDCRTPPNNINRATGIAGGTAGAAVLVRTLGRRGS